MPYENEHWVSEDEGGKEEGKNRDLKGQIKRRTGKIHWKKRREWESKCVREKRERERDGKERKRDSEERERDRMW